MKATVISPSDPSWRGFLAEVDHDTYHLPAYVEVEARRLDGEPFAILVEGVDFVVLLPLVLRTLPGSVRGNDAVSPYGYPGPLVNAAAALDDSALRRAGLEIHSTLADMGCASAFVRCHPLLPMAKSIIGDVGELRELGPTVWIDLTRNEQQRREQMNRNCRRSVNRTMQEGFVVDVDHDWEALDDFLALYRATMDRAHASGSYYFNRDYFLDLRQTLGSHIHMFTVSRRRQVIGAGLFLESSGIAQSHLSGAHRLPGKLSADRLMIEQAASWFAARGNRALHLGGGVGAADDSLLQFKAGFSPQRGFYAVWEIIANQELFDAAVATTALAGSVDAGVHYFPPYRMPRLD